MNNTMTVAVMVALGLVTAVVAYNYLNEPEPVANRMENAADQLGAGRLGEALDELGNETRGEKIQDDVQDALDVSPNTNP